MIIRTIVVVIYAEEVLLGPSIPVTHQPPLLRLLDINSLQQIPQLCTLFGGCLHNQKNKNIPDSFCFDKIVVFVLFSFCFPVQLKELKERQRQQNKQKAIKLGLDPE